MSAGVSGDEPFFSVPTREQLSLASAGSCEQSDSPVAVSIALSTPLAVPLACPTLRSQSNAPPSSLSQPTIGSEPWFVAQNGDYHRDRDEASRRGSASSCAPAGEPTAPDGAV